MRGGVIYFPYQKKHELTDYKLFCFNGCVKIIQVDYARFSNHRRTLYDENWQELDFDFVYPRDPKVLIEKPVQLEKMIFLAAKLAAKNPFMRVDFYDVAGKIYFGEITFFPEAGFGRFCPLEKDMKLGKLISLPEND